MGTHVHIPRMQWCLVAEIDESEALRPLWQLKLLLVVLACVTPVMAWIIGNVASRLITRPIEVLQKGIKVVGAGNLDHNVGTNATDEIGQLSRAFDQMTCDLRRTTTSIDELNKEIVERKQAQERIEKLNLLQASLLDTGDLEAKLKRITDSVVDIFDADFCRIWLTGPGDLCDSGCIHAQTNQGPHVCDSRDRCLHMLASSGRYVHIDGEMHRRVPFGAYKIGRVAAGQDHKFLTNDVANDPRIHNHQWAKELGLVSFAGYQLCPPGGKTVGVLAVFAKHAISPMEDALLESLGNVIVQVIQTAEAEKEVQQQKEFLENVIEALSHPFYVIDVEDYTLKLANSAACANGILEGDTCHRVTHETDTPCRGEDHPCPLKEVKKTKKSMITEHIHYDADGQARHFEVHGHPVFDGRGNVAQVIEYSLDITERKRAEDTLKQTLADLERFNRLAVGRELRMIELKREVNDMAERAEIEPPYDLVFAEDTQSTF